MEAGKINGHKVAREHQAFNEPSKILCMSSIAASPHCGPFFPMKEEVRTAIGLRKAQRSHQHAIIYPRVTGSLEGATGPQNWNLDFPWPPPTGAEESIQVFRPSRGQVSIL